MALEEQVALGKQLEVGAPGRVAEIVALGHPHALVCVVPVEQLADAPHQRVLQRWAEEGVRNSQARPRQPQGRSLSHTLQ